MFIVREGGVILGRRLYILIQWNFFKDVNMSILAL